MSQYKLDGQKRPTGANKFSAAEYVQLGNYTRAETTWLGLVLVWPKGQPKYLLEGRIRLEEMRPKTRSRRALRNWRPGPWQQARRRRWFRRRLCCRKRKPSWRPSPIRRPVARHVAVRHPSRHPPFHHSSSPSFPPICSPFFTRCTVEKRDNSVNWEKRETTQRPTISKRRASPRRGNLLEIRVSCLSKKQRRETLVDARPD